MERVSIQLCSMHVPPQREIPIHTGQHLCELGPIAIGSQGEVSSHPPLPSSSRPCHCQNWLKGKQLRNYRDWFAVNFATHSSICLPNFKKYSSPTHQGVQRNIPRKSIVFRSFDRANADILVLKLPSMLQELPMFRPKFHGFTAMITTCLINLAYRQSAKQLLQSCFFNTDCVCVWRYIDRYNHILCNK